MEIKKTWWSKKTPYQKWKFSKNLRAFLLSALLFLILGLIFFAFISITIDIVNWTGRRR